MKRTTHVLFFSILIVLVAGAPGIAQEIEHEEHGENASHEAHEQSGEASEHESHNAKHQGFKNEFAIFLGATDKKEHDAEFTWGIEYVYEFAHRWGIGGLFDYAGGTLRNAVVGVPVYFYPGGRWKLMAAPGVEFHRGTGAQVEHHKSEPSTTIDEDATYFLLRLSVGYDIIVAEHYSIIPTVDVDFVDGHRVWVYGFNFAYKF